MLWCFKTGNIGPLGPLGYWSYSFLKGPLNPTYPAALLEARNLMFVGEAHKTARGD